MKECVRAAGGVPFLFNTIGVDDGIAMGHNGMKYSLPSREIIADSVETMIEAHRFDLVDGSGEVAASQSAIQRRRAPDDICLARVSP